MHDRRGPVLEIAARDDAGAPRDLLALWVELWAAGAGAPSRVEVDQVGLGRYLACVVPLASAVDGLEMPKEVTRRYALRLEAHVRAHPADWFWSHNRWKLKKPLYAR